MRRGASHVGVVITLAQCPRRDKPEKQFFTPCGDECAAASRVLPMAGPLAEGRMENSEAERLLYALRAIDRLLHLSAVGLRIRTHGSSAKYSVLSM